MASLYDTFFFHPVDTFSITAGYTIPVGFFARIYPNSPYAFVDGSEIFLGLGFTISLNNSYYGLGANFSGKISTNAANTAKEVDAYAFNFTSATGETFRKAPIVSVTGTSIIEAYLLNNALAKVIAGTVQGNVAAVVGGMGIRIHSTSASIFTVKPFIPHHVFVKEGTILNGDFTVELFKNPLGV